MKLILSLKPKLFNIFTTLVLSCFITASYLKAFANEKTTDQNTSSVISIEPYTGIFKEREILRKNIKLIEMKADDALQTVFERLGIKNTIENIHITFADKYRKSNREFTISAVAYSETINNIRRPVVHLNPKYLNHDSYDIEKVLTHELTHAVMRDLLKERYRELPKWFKEGIAVWVADQIKEKEKYLVSKYVLFDKSPSLLINGIGGKHTLDDYYESGLFFDYLEKEYGEKAILKLIQLINSGDNYRSALIESTGFSFQTLQINARQYSNKRLNQFLTKSNYDRYKKIPKPLLRATNWAQVKSDYTTFIEKYPESIFITNATYHLGRSNMSLRDYPRAREHFDDILLNHSHNSPLFSRSLYNKGVVLLKEGEREQANEPFEQYLETFPNTTKAQKIDELLIEDDLAKEEINDLIKEKKAKEHNFSLPILIKPYTGIFKDREILRKNIKLIKTRAPAALQTVQSRLGIKNNIGQIGIKFTDRLGFKKSHSITTYSENRTTIVFNSRKLLFDSYDIDKQLIHEFTQAVLANALKERHHELPKWLKDGLAVWVANQLEEQEKQFVSWKAISNISSLNLINDIGKETGFNAYYDGLFFDFLEKEYGVKTIQKLVQSFVSESEYQNAFKISTGSNLQELLREVHQYTSNRLTQFLNKSNYEQYYEINKLIKRKKPNWIKIKANFESFIEQYPESNLIPNAIFQLGISNKYLENYPEAKKQFDDILLNFSHKITLSRKSFFQKGDVLIKLKKKKQASELFTRYLEMFPESDIKSSIDDYIKKGLITLNTKSVR